MNKNHLLLLAVVGIGAYAIYRGVKGSEALAGPKLLHPLPAGAALTGQTTTTHNGRAPNDPNEVVGTGDRNWAEISLPDGGTDWAETA